MQVAMRELMTSNYKKEPWVNPYNTNGLVAMWDAIWNAGGGVHRSSLTAWKDLVGDNDITLGSAIVQKTDIAIPRYQTLSLAVAGFENRSWTIEILTYAYNVARSVAILNLANDKTNARAIWSRDSTTTTNSRIQINMPYGTGTQNSYNFGSTAYYNWTQTQLFSMCGRYSLSGSSRGFYRNGQAIGYSNYSPNTYTESATATLGGEQHVRCVRIYNRTLSMAETATNYAIDSTRYV